MAGKVQIATFRERVSKKSGERYLKAAFGPFDLLLFKDLANPIQTEGGGKEYAWNLVVSENWHAWHTSREFQNLESAVSDDQLPE